MIKIASGWAKAHSKTGFSVNVWKSSKTLRRFIWIPKRTLNLSEPKSYLDQLWCYTFWFWSNLESLWCIGKMSALWCHTNHGVTSQWFMPRKKIINWRNFSCNFWFWFFFFHKFIKIRTISNHSAYFQRWHISTEKIIIVFYISA